MTTGHKPAQTTRASAEQATVDPDRAQRDASERVWGSGRLLPRYHGRTLRSAERALFDAHPGALAGEVLELGCGGGRLTAHLIDLASAVHGIDLAPAMVDHCRRAYPRATFSRGDLRDLSCFGDASFDAVVAGFAVIDVLSDDERRRLLDDVHRILRPGGLFIFSTHNLACAPLLRGPLRSISARTPVSLVSQIVRIPRSLRNRRRLLPSQRVGADHAILNDAAHDFSLLHYYITRDDQERQLARHGFALRECLRLDAEAVGPGESATGWHELHYAATREARAGATR